MNITAPSRSVQVCAFGSNRSSSFRRATLLGTVLFLPAIFAANAPPTGSVDNPLNVVVTNTGALPVLTQDVDNPAFQPFRKQVIINFLEGSFGGDATFQVPLGKRLVIEFVSFTCTLLLGQNPTFNSIRLVDNVGVFDFYFSVPLQGNHNAFRNLFVGTSRTRLYCEPGHSVTLSVRRNLDSGTGQASVSVSGYFVDVP